MPATNMLEVNDLQCIRGDRSLFSNLHYKLESAGVLQIRAENGAGKTSLLRILCGLSMPEKGEVKWNGVPILKCRDDYYRALAYCGHHPPLNATLTALENLDAARALWTHSPTLSSREALHRVSLDECMDQPCQQLSAGQRQRIALAGIWLRLGGIWILDEPTTALDQAACQLLEQMINEQIGAGGLVIFTSHRELAFNATKPQQLYLEQYQ